MMLDWCFNRMFMFHGVGVQPCNGLRKQCFLNHHDVFRLCFLQLEKHNSSLAICCSIMLWRCICSHSLLCSVEATSSTCRRIWTEEMAFEFPRIKINCRGKDILLIKKNVSKENREHLRFLSWIWLHEVTFCPKYSSWMHLMSHNQKLVKFDKIIPCMNCLEWTLYL